MPNLPRQHANLSAMVRIVGDEISDKTGDIGTEILDSAIALQCMPNERMQGLEAALQPAHGLHRTYARSIELLGNFNGLGGL